jgi:hypothetical protein
VADRWPAGGGRTVIAFLTTVLIVGARLAWDDASHRDG